MSVSKPISVWHQQPFEVPVLRDDVALAIVYYRKPGSRKSIRFWKNIYLLKKGEAFGAVGNIECATIRSWQFKSYLSLPKKHTVDLFVRRMQNKGGINVHVPLLVVPKENSRPISSNTILISEQAIALNSSEIDIHTHLNITFNSQPQFRLPEWPKLKNFNDSV